MGKSRKSTTSGSVNHDEQRRTRRLQEQEQRDLQRRMRDDRQRQSARNVHAAQLGAYQTAGVGRDGSWNLSGAPRTSQRQHRHNTNPHRPQPHHDVGLSNPLHLRAQQAQPNRRSRMQRSKSSGDVHNHRQPPTTRPPHEPHRHRGMQDEQNLCYAARLQKRRNEELQASKPRKSRDESRVVRPVRSRSVPPSDDRPPPPPTTNQNTDHDRSREPSRTRSSRRRGIHGSSSRRSSLEFDTAGRRRSEAYDHADGSRLPRDSRERSRSSHSRRRTPRKRSSIRGKIRDWFGR